MLLCLSEEAMFTHLFQFLFNELNDDDDDDDDDDDVAICKPHS